MNYFSLFSLTESFDIDLASLSRTYQELQKLTHPDKFAGGSEQQKRVALQRNSQVNDGYQVLKAPVSRAEHLLALRGVELAHETQTMRDTDFLMQQMEWREALAEVDSAEQPMDVLDELNDTVDEQQAALKQRLSSLLGQPSQGNLQEAAESVRKLKFINKLQREIAETEERLEA
ncbi:co-chaperone HscB [Alteromonas oceanisediminis]|uniref:co-chaperone HscB n=1 Tax=Alteromonas oceanisediminis TaxID=2836180 RepID=UPI001BDB3217|nr:co-chaperone HscB [Alteromonas oceanisediminis]MBT0585729.1 co-chaperone HscB [Alteromonas oceanisediminis]